MKYRPNVGLMILNSKGEIWFGKRSKTNFRSKYTEQMPQGGIDKGEKPLTAAYRELYEETGLTKNKVILLKISSKWYSYTFPQPIKWGEEQFIGQRQKWFLFLHTGTDADFNLAVNPEEIEFSSFSWISPFKIISRVIEFKRKTYRQVIREFQPVIDELTA